MVYTWLALKITAKVTGKVACNFLLPGSGSAIDFAEAGICFATGDILGGTLATAFGLVGLIPVIGGATSSAKDISRAVAEATVTVSTEVSQEIGKQVGVEIAKNGLEGAAKEAVVEGGKIAVQILTREGVREATKQIVAGAAVNLVKEVAWDVGLEATTAIPGVLLEQAVKEAASQTVRVVATETVRVVATETAKEATKEIVVATTKEAAAEAVKEVAKEAGKEGSKTVAKEVLVGLLAVGRGIASLPH